MLSRLSGQNIALIVIGLSVLIAILWYFTWYSNTLAEMDTVRTEITALNDKKAVGERARANVVQLCQVVGDLQRQKAEFLRALPSNEQFSNLLNTFRLQVSANRGQINSFVRNTATTTTSTTPPGVKAINVNMGWEGTLDSIRGLLVSLEQQQRFLKVENLSLAQAPERFGANNEPVITVNPLLESQMAMTAYVYDNPNRDNQAAPVNPVCQSLPGSQTVPGTEVPR